MKKFMLGAEDKHENENILPSDFKEEVIAYQKIQ